MSYKGQYLRGEKWFLNNRDADGNLSKDIKNDVNKMVDVDVYLENKDKEENKGKKENKSKGKK